MAKKKVASATEYRVVADGINWPDPSAPEPEDPSTHGRRDYRAERGDMVRVGTGARELPPEIAAAFLEAAHVEALEDQPAAAPAAPAAEQEG